MTNNEKKLAALFLKEAASQFSNHGCNDVPDSVWDTLGDERNTFLASYRNWQGEDNSASSLLHVPDYAAMDYLAHLLEQEAS